MHEEDRGHTYAPFTGDLLFIKDLYMVTVKRFRITFTANVNLYHVTIASDQGFPLLYLSLAVLYFYKKNYCFHPSELFWTVVWFCFVCLFVCFLFRFNFCLKKLSTRICRLTFTITVTLNLCNDPYSFGVFYYYYCYYYYCYFIIFIIIIVIFV